MPGYADQATPGWRSHMKNTHLSRSGQAVARPTHARPWLPLFSFSDISCVAAELVDALAAEAARLGRDYHGTYGYGYLAWRRRLDDLIDDQQPERDAAHTALLDIYERAGAES